MTSRRKFIKNSSLLLSGITLSNFKAFATTKAPIKIGVIGCGVRGKWGIKSIQEIPDLVITAICDIYEPNLQAAKSLTNGSAKAYNDYKDLLKSPDIDAVYIATPLNLHYPMIMEALAQSKHIYCEKTLSYSVKESFDVLKKVQASGQIFQVGYQYRYYPLMKKVRKLINEGQIGNLTYVQAHWNRNNDWRRKVPSQKFEKLINWRLYKEYSGGLIAELCTHQIDLVNWILQENPQKVSGFGGIDYYKDGRETYDNVHLVYQYPKGLKACFTSLTTNAFESFIIKFYGTEGTIIVKGPTDLEASLIPEPNKKPQNVELVVDGTSGATQTGGKHQDEVLIKLSEDEKKDAENVLNPFIHFYRAIQSNKQPLVDVLTGHNACIAVHMGNEAMETNKVVNWIDKI